MHELFSIGWGEPDVREQWKRAHPQGRASCCRQANARPYEPDPIALTCRRRHTAPSGTAAPMDICRVHAALQAAAIGEAAPVKQILSAIPGIDLDGRNGPTSAPRPATCPAT